MGVVKNIRFDQFPK